VHYVGYFEENKIKKQIIDGRSNTIYDNIQEEVPVVSGG